MSDASVSGAARKLLAIRGESLDEAQHQVALKLDDVRSLLSRPRFPSIRYQLFGTGRNPPVRGLYIWGGVGRGKTFLMDLFYASLTSGRKIRLHFYHFMRQIHDALRQHAGKADPLLHIAREWSSKVRVICLDEFFVIDITDAMLLGGLLKFLFDEHVTLVTTSNQPPHLLYENGLQRQRFLPAIELLEQHTEVVHLGGGRDYRLEVLKGSGTYFSPTGPTADRQLEDSFLKLKANCAEANPDLEINGRIISACRVAGDIAWFDFAALCDGPRSPSDYIEIADCYQTILLGNVPQLHDGIDDMVRRFISLIDEFYDRRVKILISAAAPIAELYTGKTLQFDFERTRSRLLEMQSEKYMASGHHR